MNDLWYRSRSASRLEAQALAPRVVLSFLFKSMEFLKYSITYLLVEPPKNGYIAYLAPNFGLGQTKPTLLS
jgi:hypothetical protein